MTQEKTFVAERFTGALVENMEIVPSEDGMLLGIGFVPAQGDILRVVIPLDLMEIVVDAIAGGVRRCHARHPNAEAELPEHID